MHGDRMRGVHGRLKCGSTTADLAPIADQVGTMAKFMIMGTKTTKRGTPYPREELQAMCDALDSALVALTASSPAEDGAPTVSRVAPKSLAGLITATLDSKFFEELGDRALWAQRDQKQWLRSNVTEFLAGSEVATVEDLYTGKYAERAAVEGVTKMFQDLGAALVACKLDGEDDDFNLGSNAEAMRGAVAKAVATVIPQMWLDMYDKVLPNHGETCAGKSCASRASRLATGVQH